jgi:hypothetical protein
MVGEVAVAVVHAGARTARRALRLLVECEMGLHVAGDQILSWHENVVLVLGIP